jgi:hypothetical protein
VNQWISIEDERPKVGSLLLYYFDPVGIHLGFYRGYDWCNVIDGNDDSKVCRKEGHIFEHYMNMGCLCGEVTHWMNVSEPLPQEIIDAVKEASFPKF